MLLKKKRKRQKKFNDFNLFWVFFPRILIIRKTNKTVKSFYNNLFIYYN